MTSLKISSYSILALALLSAATTLATDFYASPTGTSSGTGSLGQPWTLATALAQPAAVKPGDRIWLRGGIYHGPLTSSLTGTAAAPIVVRQYPGERATIDGNGTGSGGVILNINGAYTWFWGFEIMNSSTNRYSPNSGSAGGNGFGIYIFGISIRCINLTIHDTDQGIGSWQNSLGDEMYGNIISNNGWMGSDRGHGHGIYVQNVSTPRRLIDNIIFNQFSHGVHGYTEGGSLNQLYFEGNISFNNGYLEGTFERNLLIGSGVAIAQSPSLVSNYTYYTPTRQLGENNIGYSAGCTAATVINNYFAGGKGLHVTNCTVSNVSGNTFYDTNGTSNFYSGNTYYSANTPPSGIQVFVRPNQYEPGRGNIAVFNWSHAGTVGVDLSSIVTVGSTYQILDAQNFFGPAIVSGTYSGGLVQIPMTGQVVAQPIGSVPAAPLPTEPEFGAFVVLANSGPVPLTTSIAAPAAGATVAGTVTVSATTTGTAAIASVQLKLDGANLGSPVTTAPYRTTWDTTTATNAAHTLSAVATDVLGSTATATLLSVTVNNNPDNVPPSVSISAPANGQTVSGSVTLSAAASDNISVAGVQFQVDGVNFGTEKTTAPYTTTWDSTVILNGTHTLSAIARDVAGNRATASIGVTSSNVVVAPTPAAYWSFDAADISGNLALDRSGNGLNATMLNTTATTGAVNQALSFNGGNSYLQANGLNLTSSLTLAAWIKTSSIRTEAILSKYDTAGTESGYLLKTNPNGTIGMQFGGANQGAYGNRLADDVKPINDGKWHHIAVVITIGQTVAFYVDGALSSTLPIKTAAASNGAPFDMGTLPYTFYGAFFSGSLDEVRVYTQVLTTADVARLAAGVTAAPDTTPPTVSITAPAGGQSVQGTVNVTAAAADNVGVTSVQFKLDGANLGSPVTTAPYQTSWNTAGLTGTHTLSAVASDAAGNTGTAAAVAVTIATADSTPPSISISAPCVGQSVQGTVTVSANASDNVGVTRVQFLVDGQNLGNPLTTAPYQVSWNTAGLTGTHTLSAVASDAAGNTGTAPSISVTVSSVDTTPPSISISAPGTGQSVQGTVTVSANASDNVGVTRVQFMVNGQNLGSPVTLAPFQTSWNTTGLTGTQTLSAVAFDAAGNSGTANAVTVTIAASDSTPPSVSISAPSAGQSVQGTVTVTASATDNVGVTRVQFFADGQNLGNPVSTAPYQTSWNTTGLTGTHMLSAVAYDAAGNSGMATAIPVTVTGVVAGGTSVTFLSTDAGTKGSWKGVYGADGFWINSDLTSLPGYAQVTSTGSSYVWVPSIQDLKCLQKGASTATDRIASTWYGPSSFLLDVNITGGAHQVALYALDFDGANRTERIDVIDPSTGATLDSRQLSGYSSGVYAIWNVSGHVQFRVTNTSGPNSVVAGIFFGPGQSTTVTAPVITQNPSSITVTTNQTASFTIAASGAGLSYQWQSQPAGGNVFSNIAGATAATYSTTGAASGTQFRVVVSNSAGTATSLAATLTVTSPVVGSTAAFVKTDVTTHGAWSGVYGSQGQVTSTGNPTYPSYAQVNLTGASVWNNGATTDPAAISGIMSCWYGGTQFSVDLVLTDSASHQVALYVADWFNGGRVETITISDAVTGTVLDTRTASGFLAGQYLVWNLSGHVTITITRNAGPNPVLSGLFFQ